jgi:hypothetical protein
MPKITIYHTTNGTVELFFHRPKIFDGKGIRRSASSYILRGLVEIRRPSVPHSENRNIELGGPSESSAVSEVDAHWSVEALKSRLKYYEDRTPRQVAYMRKPGDRHFMLHRGSNGPIGITVWTSGTKTTVDVDVDVTKYRNQEECLSALNVQLTKLEKQGYKGFCLDPKEIDRNKDRTSGTEPTGASSPVSYYDFSFRKDLKLATAIKPTLPELQGYFGRNTRAANDYMKDKSHMYLTSGLPGGKTFYIYSKGETESGLQSYEIDNFTGLIAEHYPSGENDPWIGKPVQDLIDHFSNNQIRPYAKNQPAPTGVIKPAEPTKLQALLSTSLPDNPGQMRDRIQALYDETQTEYARTRRDMDTFDQIEVNGMIQTLISLAKGGVKFEDAPTAQRKAEEMISGWQKRFFPEAH